MASSIDPILALAERCYQLRDPDAPRVNRVITMKLVDFFESADKGDFEMKPIDSHDVALWSDAIANAIGRRVEGVTLVDIDEPLLRGFSSRELATLRAHRLPGVALWDRLMSRHRTYVSGLLARRHGVGFEREFDEVLLQSLATRLELCVERRFQGRFWERQLTRVQCNLWNVIRYALALAFAGEWRNCEALCILALLMSCGVPLCERGEDGRQWIVLCG